MARLHIMIGAYVREVLFTSWWPENRKVPKGRGQGSNILFQGTTKMT
jgi:hypothetical protein